MKFKIFFLLFLLLFIFGCSYQVVYIFFTRQISSSSERNNLCGNTSTEARYCKTDKKLFQYKKVLWFVTDGLPIQYSDQIFRIFQSNSLIYGIDVPGAKYSHAIYTSWLTGQLPTNYHGAAIQGDQLLEQMNTAGFSLKYIGPEWSFLAINGKSNYDNLFTGGIDIHKEPLDGSVSHSYPFFFENQTTINYFENEYIPNLLQNNQSMIAHSGVFDHINHGVFRNGGEDVIRLKEHAYIHARDLLRVKFFIDRHPEYLLILSSDHGVDANTAAGYVMHGFTNNGNEGYLLFYNPSLPSYRHRGKIDVVDVAPTIAKYLYNVNIPFNSVGKVQNYYGENSQALKQKVNILKQNLVQLKQCADYRGRNIPIIDSDIDDLLLVPAKKESIEQLENTIDIFKDELYNVMDAPYNTLILFCILLLITFIFVIYYLHNGFYISKHMLLLIFIYFPSYIHLFFGQSFYTKIFVKGTCFFLPNSLLTFISLYLWYKQYISYQNIFSDNTNENTNENNSIYFRLYSISMQLLFTIFIVNWIELAITLLFGASWKIYISSLTFGKDIIYLCVFLLLLWLFTCLQWQKQTNIKHRSMIKALKSSVLHPSFIISLIILILFRLYEYTEDNSSMYIYFGIHTCILIACILGFLWFLCYHIILKQSMHGFIIIIHLFIFLLWMDSTCGRLLNLFWFCKCIFTYLPLIELSFYNYQYIIQHYKNNILSKTNEMFIKHKHDSILLIQCLIILFINQAFYHLGVSMGDKISMDLHPFSGKVGVETYDTYPVIAGFMMCFHKYGYLSIFVLYCVVFITTNIPYFFVSLSPFSYYHAYNEFISCYKYLQIFDKPYWNYSNDKRLKFFISILFIFQLSSVTAYFLLLVGYTPEHYIEGSAIYSALWGTILCCFIIFIIIEYFFQYIRINILKNESNDHIEFTKLLQKEHEL